MREAMAVARPRPLSSAQPSRSAVRPGLCILRPRFNAKSRHLPRLVARGHGGPDAEEEVPLEEAMGPEDEEYLNSIDEEDEEALELALELEAEMRAQLRTAKEGTEDTEELIDARFAAELARRRSEGSDDDDSVEEDYEDEQEEDEDSEYDEVAAELEEQEEEEAEAEEGDAQVDAEDSLRPERGLRKGRVLDDAVALAGSNGELDLDAVIAAAAGAVGAAGGPDMAVAGSSYDEQGEEGAAGSAAGVRAYPDPPRRSYQLPELLRRAGLDEAAAGAPDVEITNITTCNSEVAGPGSLYVCVPAAGGLADGHDWVEEATELGVSAVLSQRPAAELDVPAGTPVVQVDDTLAALGALAAAFYEHPSRRCRTVGFVGSYGKTTSAWLARGVFEEDGVVTGMVGTIEHAIAEERLTEEGDIWEPDEEDVTLERNCSTPFHITPYEGKYGCPNTTPDALHIQKVLGGAVDRGAQTTLIECCPTAAADGRLDKVDFDVLVFTNIVPEKAGRGAWEYEDDEEEEQQQQSPVTDEQLRAMLQQAQEDAAAAAPSGEAEEASSSGSGPGGSGSSGSGYSRSKLLRKLSAKEHQEVAAYTERVAAMFDQLRDGERQRAVVNVDDPEGPEMARRATEAGAQVITFALDDRQADIWAEKVKHTIWETELLVRTPVGRLQIITPQLGRQSAQNVLAAVGVGLACGVPLRSIVAGIEAVDIIPGRCETIDERQPFSVVVDYAKTADELARLLDGLRDCGARRTLLVLGAEGSSSQAEKAALGAVAHAKADGAFFTNHNPGAAFPEECIAGLVAGLPEEIRNRHSGSVYPWLQDPHRVPHWFQKWQLQYQSEAGKFIIEDRFQAIRVAIGMAKPRDMVVVVGKGHEDFQEYWDGISASDTIKSWFDDRVECRNALSKLPGLNGLKDLDRAYLPWTRYPEERDQLMVAGIADFEVAEDD